MNHEQWTVNYDICDLWIMNYQPWTMKYLSDLSQCWFPHIWHIDPTYLVDRPNMVGDTSRCGQLRHDHASHHLGLRLVLMGPLLKLGRKFEGQKSHVLFFVKMFQQPIQSCKELPLPIRKTPPTKKWGSKTMAETIWSVRSGKPWRKGQQKIMGFSGCKIGIT